jgi:carbonic anhydrase
MARDTDGGEFARLLAANERYTEAFDRSRLRAAPLSGLAIVACMDGRFLVEDALGLRAGDAHIIRNAGGLVTDDVIRSLVVSQQLMGTEEIILIQHSGCGLHGVDDDDLRSRVGAMAGMAADDVHLTFGGFPDLEANLRSSAASLREHPYLRRVPVHGLIYDVATGRLYEIV